MPKYWGKFFFSLRSLPEVGQKQKTEREKKRKREKKLNDGNNKGQLRIANATSGGARKAAWAKKERKKERKWVIMMASYALQHHLGWRTQSRLAWAKLMDIS